jgi:hypothetical protein
MDLSVYIENLNAIQRELNLDSESSRLDTYFTCLQNYFEQLNAIKNSVLFNSNKVNTDELRAKLLLKLNKLISDNVELVESLL